jgi:hypothetical protein
MTPSDHERTWELELLTVHRPSALLKWGTVAVTSILGAPFVFGCPFLWAWWVSLILERSNTRPRSYSGTIAVTQTNLIVTPIGDRQRVIPRALVRDGWIEEHEGFVEAVIRLRDGRVVRASGVSAVSDKELKEILRALELSADQRVVQLRLGSLAASQGQGVIVHFLGSWLLAAALLASIAGVVESPLRLGLMLPIQLSLVTLVCAAACVAFGLYLATGSATIGADGITYRSPWKKQFLPFSNVESMELTHNWLHLRNKDGKVIVLPLRRLADKDSVPQDAMFRRLEEAFSVAKRTGSAEAMILSTLERGSRDVAAWKKHLQELLKGGAHYRRTGVDIDAFEGALVDVRATAEQRIGAAIALSGRSAEDPNLKRRARIAASAIANDKLRIAIDQALDGDLQQSELEAALAEAAPVVKKLS